MSTWLFTYNADKWNWENFDNVIASSIIGECDFIEPWRSLSKSASVGDTCYLIKLGNAPRGIFAKGTINSKSYIASATDEHTEKGKNYNNIKLTQIIDWREWQTCPIIDIEILRNKFPMQKWNPQSSGISIKTEYVQELNMLWQITFDNYICQNINIHSDIIDNIDKKADYLAENDWDNYQKESDDCDISDLSYLPQERKLAITDNKIIYFPRDVKNKTIAKKLANYKCEYNSNHSSFVSRIDGNLYVEPHHLIPMAFTEEFEYSLDVPANIVCLCSNCHNQIHYGKNNKEIIIKLYNDRKEKLEKSGIKISLLSLISMYKIEDD